MTGRRVVVIGGGLAGITAALDCALDGAEVTLLEAKGRLGGAVYSFRRDGLHLDNGQHVFLRCCTAYRALLDRLDAARMVALQPRLRIPVMAPGAEMAVLERSQLPAPLHLAASLARYSLLPARDRIAVVRAMTSLRRLDPDDPTLDDRSFGEWLAEQGQRAAAQEALWELIARPTLNLLPHAASLAQAAQVFQTGLLSDSTAGDVGHAVVPLSDIHDRAARATLQRAGVEVRLRQAATAVSQSAAGFNVEVSGSPTLSADAVIVAVPPDRCARLLPAAAGVAVERLQGLGRSPIVNLHVVLDRKLLEERFIAAVRSPLQWIFDRTDSSGARRGQYLAISLSAAEEELAMTSSALRQRYLPELWRLLGERAGVDHFFVTREHSATFRAAPGVRALRPGPETAIPGLLLAGNWTDTGWPATMESAVRSGHAAARVAAEQVPRRRRSPSAPSRSLTVLAPMALEARALSDGVPDADVRRVGVGLRRAGSAARRLRSHAPVLLAGFCGALDDQLCPGDVVLAERILGPSGEVECADPTLLAGVLRRAGLRVHTGAVASTARVVMGDNRRRLREAGALAVDMESYAVAQALAGEPVTVLRVVLDGPDHELYRPVRTAQAARTAYRSLRRAAPLLTEWGRAFGDREVVLAAPRASCAGVERAVQMVERALEEEGPPVYVRKQIVHNSHVIADLERRGAVFVDEVDEVPGEATMIFSAHGVSPEVRNRARERQLDVIDATCPLVAKVHAEARRFRARDYDIVLVGHAGHEEVEGTFGEAPERTHVVSTVEEVERLQPRDPRRIAYLTQTTLAVDDTTEVVDALRERFPALVGPPKSDICYATQNRQDAVRALAAECDTVLVIGSRNSSNSRRLVEVSERAGCPAILIEDKSEIRPEMIADTRRVGLTAGASAPEALVEEVVDALAALGRVRVTQRRVASEDIRFKLPGRTTGTTD